MKTIRVRGLLNGFPPTRKCIPGGIHRQRLDGWIFGCILSDLPTAVNEKGEGAVYVYRRKQHRRIRAARILALVALAFLAFAPDHILGIVSIALPLLGDRVTRYFRF